MYEKNAGSKRLISALNCLDDRKISTLTRLLNYVDERQLEQDIKALSDVIKEAHEKNST